MKIYVGIDIAKLNHFAAAISSDGEIIIEPFKFTAINLLYHSCSCMIIRKLIITYFLSFNIVVQYNSDTMDF